MKYQKMHVTKKQLRNQCDLILDVPYGSTIFQHDRPQYYNAGVYGWNWDAYITVVDTSDGYKRVGIVTGYRNLIGLDIPYNSDDLKAVESLLKNNRLSGVNELAQRLLANQKQ